MKTAFVAVTAAAIRCRQYMENQVVGIVGAASAWEWRVLNSLAVLAWLKAVFRNGLAAGPGAPFAERAWYEEGTRFFCILAPFRRASVQENTFSGCEARYVGARRL